MIHPSAQISSQASIESDVTIGAYTVVESGVEIGAGTKIEPHVVIHSGTKIGCNNRIASFTSLGAEPQHRDYKGEPTRLIIGDDNIIKEFCSIHRGTVAGGNATTIGKRNLIMNYTHIAHDCTIADHVVLVSAVILGGHVVIEDYAYVGSGTAINPSCRIGTYSMTGPRAGCQRDIPPYVRALPLQTSLHLNLSGINTHSLQQNNVNAETIEALSTAYRVIFRSRLELADAAQQLADLCNQFSEVAHLINFLSAPSARGYVRRVGTSTD